MTARTSRPVNRDVITKMKILRTTSSSLDFRELCNELDNELNQRYGKAQSEYDKHNVIEENNTVLVGYFNFIPVACGCMKSFDDITIEIKRMYVKKSHRRKGLSSSLLLSLEKWGAELGFSKAILETGKGQPEAINLYKKKGYQIIGNYGPYIGIKNSVCMEKKIK